VSARIFHSSVAYTAKELADNNTIARLEGVRVRRADGVREPLEEEAQQRRLQFGRQRLPVSLASHAPVYAPVARDLDLRRVRREEADIGVGVVPQAGDQAPGLGARLQLLQLLLELLGERGLRACRGVEEVEDGLEVSVQVE
jgi:hypothetical protein